MTRHAAPKSPVAPGRSPPRSPSPLRKTAAAARLPIMQERSDVHPRQGPGQSSSSCRCSAGSSSPPWWPSTTSSGPSASTWSEGGRGGQEADRRRSRPDLRPQERGLGHPGQPRPHPPELPRRAGDGPEDRERDEGDAQPLRAPARHRQARGRGGPGADRGPLPRAARTSTSRSRRSRPASRP